MSTVERAAIDRENSATPPTTLSAGVGFGTCLRVGNARAYVRASVREAEAKRRRKLVLTPDYNSLLSLNRRVV